MPSALPLAGINVVDASQGVAGPHAGFLLAQHGANVVKIEPLEGDWGRTLGKRYDDLSAHAVAFNRGKRSIALDLKQAEGREIVRALSARADIFLENFRPGVMKRFGLDYASVATLQPDIIYLSVTGYSQSGPYAQRPVTDSIIQAFSGWMTLHRDEAGTPMRSGIIAIDVMTGLYAYQAVASALVKRLRFGGGAYIDCSMLQSAAAFQAAKIMEFVLEDGQPEVSYVPVGVMPTNDGYINISAMRDAHYEALCKVLGRPDLASDERFNSRDKRRANKDAVMRELNAAFRTRPTAHWAEKLTAVDVMNAPINTYGQFVSDVHVKATETLVGAPQSGIGETPAARVPGVAPWSGDDPRLPAPHVGEHTAAILAELGYGSERIAQLESRQVIRQGSLPATQDAQDARGTHGKQR